jgi:hypothetical protein
VKEWASFIMPQQLIFDSEEAKAELADIQAFNIVEERRVRAIIPCIAVVLTNLYPMYCFEFG